MASPPPQKNSMQKVHPSAPEDIEAGRAADEQTMKQTTPLMPKNNLPGPPRVAVQFPKDQVFPRRMPPPRSMPPPKPKRRGGCCCRLLCCACCFLFILILSLVAAAGVLYLVMKPRMPKYAVENLTVTGLSRSGQTLRSQMAVTVRARNPNKHIGIYYLDDSKVSVEYDGTSLSSGSIPAFYQGHKNTTLVHVKMNGSAGFNAAKTAKLKTQNQEGKVPLFLKADVPVKVKVGALKLFKVTVRLRCDVVVDRLVAKQAVKVIQTECKVKRKFW